jgi:hypothetical protein
MTAPWAEIFQELVREIVRHLEDPEDRAWCRCVCRRFYEADRHFRLFKWISPSLWKRRDRPYRAVLRHWLTLCDGPLFSPIEQSAMSVAFERPYEELTLCTLNIFNYMIFVSVREESGELGFCSIYVMGKSHYLRAEFPSAGTTLAAWLGSCPKLIDALRVIPLRT